jgi:uncharacterized protein (TIGR03086 family)
VSDLIERLERTGRQFASLVAGIEDDQWSAPTPCPDWDVAALVRHVVEGNRIFIGVLSGHPVSPQLLHEEHATHGANLLPGDVTASVAELVAAFRRPEVLERPVAIPVGTVPGAVAVDIRVVENVVHGWDLATATGPAPPYDDADAEAALVFSRRAMGIVPEGRKPFADPVVVPDDAPPLDRLVALLGRRPGSLGDSALRT